MNDYIRRIVDRVDSEVDAEAERAAAAFYTQVAKDAERTAAERRPANATDQDWNEIFLPAFLWKFHTQLMVKVAEGALGWRDVYFHNTRRHSREAQRRDAG
ncbi:MAG: hypothetical protein ACRDNE_10845 [Gaiellaceae bacterium]